MIELEVNEPPNEAEFSTSIACWLFHGVPLFQFNSFMLRRQSPLFVSIGL
jgi:hypothetical protein